MTEADILSAAADLIERTGFTQAAFARDVDGNHTKVTNDDAV